MEEFNPLEIYKSKLTDAQFLRIAKYIEKNYGIKLPLTKKAMVQNRLYKRLKALKIKTFDRYVNYVFSPEGKNELNELVNVITTNKTEFFREPQHFEVLKTIVKDLKYVKVWSAACSSGEEPYSIAIILEELLKEYRIFASDISDIVLKIAKSGIYSAKQVQNIPEQYLKRYFTRLASSNKIYYKISPNIQQKITFLKINLVSPPYPIDKDLDIIFLRNVLIYFKREVQETVLKTVLNYLKPYGYLFLGMTEIIFDFHLPLKKISNSVYQYIL